MRSRIGAISRPCHCAVSTRSSTSTKLWPGRIIPVYRTRVPVTNFNLNRYSCAIFSTMHGNWISAISCSVFNTNSAWSRAFTKFRPLGESTVHRAPPTQNTILYIFSGPKICTIATSVFRFWIRTKTQSFLYSYSTRSWAMAKSRPLRVTAIYRTMVSITFTRLCMWSQTRAVSSIELRFRIRTISSSLLCAISARFGTFTKYSPFTKATVYGAKIRVTNLNFYTWSQMWTISSTMPGLRIGTTSISLPRSTSTRDRTLRKFRPLAIASVYGTWLCIAIFYFES